MQSILESTAVAASAAVEGHEGTSPVVKGGRYLQGGSIPPRKETVWFLTDTKGDDRGFLHFTALTRSSFNDLVAICLPHITTKLILPSKGQAQVKKSRTNLRKFTARDTVAMALKYLLSSSLLKDLHVQFGASVATFLQHSWFGIDAFLTCVGPDD